MSGLKFWQIALIGAILVSVGFLIPFLTVIRVIPANLLLLFFSYAQGPRTITRAPGVFSRGQEPPRKDQGAWQFADETAMLPVVFP